MTRSNVPPTLDDIYRLIYRAQMDPSLFLEQDSRLKMDLGEGGATPVETLEDAIPHIYNVYLFGSRLYQCHSANSDYDFICIIGGKYFDGSKLFEDEHLNVNVYHWDYWMHLLRENMIWAVMVLFLPTEFIWKEARPLKQSHFILDLNRLKNACLQDASHNWAKAKRLCTHRELRNEKVSKKNIVHGIRYIKMTLQVINTGTIYDFTVGNDIWNELFHTESEQQPSFSSFMDQWNYYESKYKQLYQDLMRQVKYFAYVPESLETEEISTTKHSKRKRLLSTYMASATKQLHVMDYISRNKLFSLKRDFSIEISRPFDHSELIVCTLDKEYTPMWTCCSPVSRECSTLILREHVEDESYQVLAMSHLPIFDKYEDDGIDSDFMSDIVNIDWDSGVKIYEKIDGISCILFKYKDEWLVYSPKITDSKFKRYCHIHIAQYRRIFDGTEHELRNQLTSIFWSIWNRNAHKLPQNYNEGSAYLFTMCLDLSQHSDLGRDFILDNHTVQHTNDELFFHGYTQIGNNGNSVTEMEIEQVAKENGWRMPERFDQQFVLESRHKSISDKEQVLRQYVRSLDPTRSVGVVVVDRYMNRLQYINPQVPALAQLQIADIVEPNTNIRNIDIVSRVNDIDSFLNYSPWKDQHVLRELYEKAKTTVNRFCTYIQNIYDTTKEAHTTNKDWVEACNQYPFNFVLFDMQKLNISAREFYACTNPRKVLKAVKYWNDFSTEQEK